MCNGVISTVRTERESPDEGILHRSMGRGRRARPRTPWRPARARRQGWSRTRVRRLRTRAGDSAHAAADAAERRRPRTPRTPPAGLPADSRRTGSPARRASSVDRDEIIVVGDLPALTEEFADDAAKAAAEAGRIARFREDTRDAADRDRPSGPVPVRPGDLLGRPTGRHRRSCSPRCPPR